MPMPEIVIDWPVAPCLSSLGSPFTFCWRLFVLPTPDMAALYPRRAHSLLPPSISRPSPSSPSSHSLCVFTTAAPPLHLSPAYRPDACRRREGRRAPETDQRAARPNPLRHPKRYKLPPQADSLATLDSATATSPSPSKSSALPALAPASPRTGCLKTPKMHALGLGLKPSSTALAAPTSCPRHAQSSASGVQLQSQK
jgi:hypothetical protein